MWERSKINEKPLKDVGIVAIVVLLASVCGVSAFNLLNSTMPSHLHDFTSVFVQFKAP